MATIDDVSNRERRLARAVYVIERDMREAGDALREARLQAGLTLEQVASVIGASKSTVLRWERHQGPGPRAPELARHAAAVGLDARVRLYKAADGAQLHDRSQVDLLTKLRKRLHTSLVMDVEPPVISTPGVDARAFDAIIRIPPIRCSAEAFSRFHNCQAQLRDCSLKQRDSGVERLIVVVKDTRHNREAVNTARDLIADAFPLGARAVLTALAAGRDPGANGLIFL